ncbi:MAG: muramidase [Cyanobium sp. CACIAM 14]|nr:MAG: muramidase [Cyanobium sp. CACIAM 14]
MLLLLPTGARPLSPDSAAAVEAPRSASARLAVARPRPALPAGDFAGAPYPITPERRALLNTIRYAEGTWLDGSAAGYRVLYGGGRFGDLRRHPEITVRNRYVSAAAGAYQFLPTTWKRASERLGLRDFGPASQDQAALHLVEERGALGAFDRHGLSAEVLARLSSEWASLPLPDGGSRYGQPVKSHDELQRFFDRELQRQRRLARA